MPLRPYVSLQRPRKQNFRPATASADTNKQASGPLSDDTNSATDTQSISPGDQHDHGDLANVEDINDNIDEGNESQEFDLQPIKEEPVVVKANVVFIKENSYFSVHYLPTIKPGTKYSSQTSPITTTTTLVGAVLSTSLFCVYQHRQP